MDKRAGLIELTEGATSHAIEKASFADGNGVLQFSVYEYTSPPRKPGDEEYVSYFLVQKVMHFGAELETVISLGSASVVQWLIEALARTYPKVAAVDSDWTVDFYGQPSVYVEDGQERDPWADRVMMQEDSSESDTKVARRVVARWLNAVSGGLRLGKWYKQSFSDETLYFLAEADQKNGGWSGVLVTVDLLRPRAAPKAKRSSVPKTNTAIWKEAAEVPEKVKEAAKSKAGKGPSEVEDRS